MQQLQLGAAFEQPELCLEKGQTQKRFRGGQSCMLRGHKSQLLLRMLIVQTFKAHTLAPGCMLYAACCMVRMQAGRLQVGSAFSATPFDIPEMRHLTYFRETRLNHIMNTRCATDVQHMMAAWGHALGPLCSTHRVAVMQCDTWWARSAATHL